MVAAVAELCEALDAHVELMEALVQASQRQQQALLGYRTIDPDSSTLLDALNHEIRGVTDALNDREQRVRALTTGIATQLGLRDAANATLRQLTTRLPKGLAGAINRRASCLRALTGSLGELQRLNQAHAQRGLQVVSAWSSLMRRDGAATRTYTSRGRTRVRTPGRSGSLVLNV